MKSDWFNTGNLGIGENKLDIKNFAEIIGEGFLADKIVKNKDCGEALKYIDTIIKGRDIMKANHLCRNSILYLGRYVRFLKWLKEIYGDTNCLSYSEGEDFIVAKLYDLKKCSRDWLEFFVWLQKETLSEASNIMGAF